jgi:hypothetical protein
VQALAHNLPVAQLDLVHPTGRAVSRPIAQSIDEKDSNTRQRVEGLAEVLGALPGSFGLHRKVPLPSG